MGRPGLLSAPVLLGAALVSSPALWRGLVDGGSASVALTRFLVSIGLCWVALSVVAALVGPPPRPEPAARDHDDADAPDHSA
jgi:hypothetical protein